MKTQKAQLGVELLETRELMASSISVATGIAAAAVPADPPVTVTRIMPLAGAQPNVSDKTVTADLRNGILTILGSKYDDTISVTKEGDKFRVSWGFEHTENGLNIGESGTTLYPLDAFSKIVVDGGLGNDTINISKEFRGEAWLYGNKGHDSISGGGGRDNIYGGDGHDYLRGRGGADVVWGGTGKDTISAGSGDVVMEGKPQGTAVANRFEAEVIRLVNQARAKEGLAPLAISGRLNLAATLHSEDMARRSKTIGAKEAHRHTVLGTTRPTVTSRLDYVGYDSWQTYRENIAYGYKSAQAVFDAWMNSPGHRANILSPDVTEIGVGFGVAADGTWFWTQNFGRDNFADTAVIGRNLWGGTATMTALGGSVYAIQDSHLYRIDAAGHYQVVGNASWGADSLMTALNGFLYVVENGRLHRVDPSDGTLRVISDNVWQGATSITTAGDGLAIIQNGRLHRVNVSATKEASRYENLSGPIWGGSTVSASLGGSLYVIQNGELHRVDPATGNYTKLGSDWNGATSMTVLGNQLYVIQANRLHRVNPADGSYKVLGNPDWDGPTSMVAYGSDLYVVQNQRLHRVDPTNGHYTVLGGAVWDGTTSMTVVGDRLIIAQADRLHNVNPADGNYRVLGGAVWNGPTSMTTVDGRLYVIQNGQLNSVDPDTGSYRVVSDADWSGTTSMTSYDGRLYVIQADRLQRVTTGLSVPWSTYTTMNDADWSGPTAMMEWQGALYVVQNSRLHRVDYGTGSFQVISSADWSGPTEMALVKDTLYIVQAGHLHRVEADGRYTKIGGSDWFDVPAITGMGGNLFVVRKSDLVRVDLLV